ncbi:MAG: hypothetical protein K2R93_21945 [Gemmatimonadaceae bacterium]|nr:hypothetical protein [Gemmatimonadaceae bacterium]
MSPHLLTRALLVATVFAASPLAAQQPVSLDVAGRSGANPSVTALGDFVAVSWSAAASGAMDVYLAVSRDGGRRFGAPVQVNSVAGQARVSGEMPPRVALVPRAGAKEPDVLVVWTVKTGNDWQLLQARSTDGGAHFGAASTVTGSDAPGARGWQAVDVDAQGKVHVLWLDHRDAAAVPMTHQHDPNAPKPDPTERAKLSRLYFATLGGSAKSVTSSVCYCCKTALVHHGAWTFAAWRQVYPGSIRDIAFAATRDGGRTFTAPVKISDDQWQIDGCPDNGPSIAVDAKQQVHAVWPTADAGSDGKQLALFYARSSNATTAKAPAFTPRRKLPTAGLASHPSVVMGAGDRPFVVWDEVVEGQRRLAAARIDADRVTPLAIPGGGALFYPAIAAVPGGAVVAWVQQGERGSSISAVRVAP